LEEMGIERRKDVFLLLLLLLHPRTRLLVEEATVSCERFTIDSFTGTMLERGLTIGLRD
jgi:hypothetical protein